VNLLIDALRAAAVPPPRTAGGRAEDTAQLQSPA
jgi:hypothetical protein